MKVIKRYVDITGKEKIMTYTYDFNHIRKKRPKCPKCYNVLVKIQIAYYGTYKSLGFYCKCCRAVFLNGIVDIVYRSETKKYP